jgi:RND superfamily putative drug exporter
LPPNRTQEVAGLTLAFGVLVDAFVVRMTLVPAVMARLGHKAWLLPKRLERRMPGVDIEGEKLLAHLKEAPAWP